MNILKTMLAASAAVVMAFPAYAEYPEKPVTLFLGFRTGDGSDTAARILATEMEAALGQKVIVENKGGAGGTVATEYVWQQSTDGYSIGFAVATTFAFTPLTGKVANTPEDVDIVATTHGYRAVYAAPKATTYDD
jgi:putative tricarboxylic transport membrane protein